MNWPLFTIFLLTCFAAGSTGGLFPPGPWYRDMKKPSWTPPNWLFPVAWSVLYVCMAVAASRVAMLPGNGLVMALWGLQIALNTLWTPVFFGLRRIRLGMAVLTGLWLAVAACMLSMLELDVIAGVLFLPYLVWVTVAGALNASVWQLNPELARNPPSAAR